MNRIATTLTTLTASVLFHQTAGAAEPTVQSLDSRLSTIESRLISIEKALNNNGSDFTYNNAATIEATNGASAVKPGSETPAPAVTPSAPAPAPQVSQAAPAAVGPGQTYVIQDGDTLGKIASKFGVERKSLLEANRLSEGQPIYIGETLMIPGSAAAPAPAPAPAPSANVAGVTPPAPAKQESVVVGETKKTAPASTTTHKVAKGDTLTSLAKKYNTSVESLKSANGLRTDTISLGQNLKIPSSKSASSTASNSTTAPASAPASVPKGEQSAAFEYDNPLLNKSETYGYYSVASGDNLYALARDFFTTMAELQRINNLGSSTIIRPGDEIIVPTSKYNAYHKTGEVANR
jgi:LysM repeat protein